MGPSQKDLPVCNLCFIALTRLEFCFPIQVYIACEEISLFNVVIERLNGYTEFRMIGEDHVGGLSLFDQRSDNRINMVHFGSGFINTSPGRGTEFFVMALGSMSIVIILRWYDAQVFLSGAAITDKGIPVQLSAGFLLKPRAHHVTFMAGTAQSITDDDLLTCICPFAAESVNTEVIRISKASLSPCVLDPM